ncbi:hypothetical protein AB0O76_14935 [Streptomyces sp. NPDC086554]
MTGARNQPEDTSAASTDGDLDDLDDDHAMCLVAVSTVPTKAAAEAAPH